MISEECEPYEGHGSSPRHDLDPRRDSLAREESLVDPSSSSLTHPSKSHPCINSTFETSSKEQNHSSKRWHKHQNQELDSDQWAGEQATLLACFRSNHGLSQYDPGQDGILMHGPSHHGPRTLLTLSIEGGGLSARCPSHQSEHVFYT